MLRRRTDPTAPLSQDPSSRFRNPMFCPRHQRTPSPPHHGRSHGMPAASVGRAHRSPPGMRLHVVCAPRRLVLDKLHTVRGFEGDAGPLEPTLTPVCRVVCGTPGCRRDGWFARTACRTDASPGRGGTCFCHEVNESSPYRGDHVASPISSDAGTNQRGITGHKLCFRVPALYQPSQRSIS